MTQISAKPRRFDRNLIVIGAGSAGLVSAMVAARLGARVTLVEAEAMGGDCLNTGCVPSKALIHMASLMAHSRKAAAMGLIGSPGAPDTRAAFAHVRRSILAVATHDSAERFESLGVDVREGHARLLSPWSVAIGDEVLTSRAIVIASGAAPTVPAIPGLDETGFLTSETLWRLQEAPRRLLILGGGPIGCELAQAFARLGSSVTMVQRPKRRLPREDDEASALVAARLELDGVQVLTGRRVTAARLRDGAREMVLADGGVVPFDALLIAIGRTPRTTGFGLEDLGVKLAENGAIATTATLQTSIPNIFACGDVAGPHQFTHAAGHQGWHAAVNALFGPFARLQPGRAVMPAVTYTDPEIARAGLNEREAKARGIAYEVTRHDLGELDRAIVDDARTGFVKLLTAPGSDRILGATIAAPRAGEMLAEIVLAMQHGIGLKKLLGTIHAYPTYTEANRDAGGAWRRAHAPAWALGVLRRYHGWRRG